MPNDVVYATADTWIDEFLFIKRGDIFWADAIEVSRHPQYFSTTPPDGAVKGSVPVVEQATAAPGEVRRGPGRPRKDG